MVTSALEGEGKTLTALNLAIAIAKEIHQTVLLVDADLRRPGIHGYFGLDREPGLTDHLLLGQPLSEILIRVGVEKLTFLPAGSPVPNPADLLNSPRMRGLVQEMKHRYRDRYLIFDASPLVPVPGAVVLAELMDGLLLVTLAGKTSQEEVARALELVERSKVLGLVLNDPKENGFSYRYKGSV